MGRLLPPGSFAVFSSLMAAFTFLGAPMAAISLLIVRKVSGIKANNETTKLRPLFFYLNKNLLSFSLISILILILLKSYIMEYFRLSSLLSFVLFSLILSLSIFNVICMAFFQGLQYFFKLGIIFGLLSITLKICLSFSFITFGLDVNGALLGVIFSMAIALSVGLMILLRGMPKQNVKSRFRFQISQLRQILPVLAATIAAAMMTQLDMILVNWYFSSSEAGDYAAASLLGKAVLYLPGALIVVLYPIVSELHASEVKSFMILRQAVLATLISCGGIGLIYYTFADEIITFLYGNKYSGAGQILRWYGFAILPMTLVIIAEQYLIAKGRILFAWLFFVIAPFQILAINVWHTELWMILVIMGGFGSVLALVGSGFMWLEAKRSNL